MKGKVFLKFLFVAFLPLILAGCFDYRDINKVSFSTSIIFDTDDFGRSVVYVDCVKPYRSTNESSDKGKRIIYKGLGKTTLEALRDINLASSYELNYSQNRAYIFTEKAAKEGIKKYTDLINNNQEFQIKPDLFVYFGEVDDLLKITSNDEEYLGLYLEELVHKNTRNPRAMRANINDYFSNETESNNTYVIGSVEIKEDALDKKIEIGGGAVIKAGKLVDKIDSREAMSYNLLTNKVKKGTLEISNPQDEKGFITLEILGNNTNSSLIYDKEKIKLIKDLKIKVSIAEIQGRAIVDKELLDYIKASKEKEIESYLQNSFKKYKEQGIDVFDIGRLLNINYPKEYIEDPISITDLEVNVDLIIEGTGIVKDSL
ncbi:MAG: Ger(x)C family spore germination protein [Clostridium sp.]|uniref:Ger(x)C family spore germination protein n=1 Tax=Clostridium sp. TaxID=1506 RepID=UPI0025BF6DA7|nr:Ger(x)C family spore germination protein [Clostridium sp.]MCI6692362.1 Ger(x)C family spore germination protein [Clostridium sp.]MDY2630376.1 Ger(x)C family spore germination protein [Clostridium sp.]MDY4252124.1 Ger(x)C family spore germination protein [Clostridium sp.]MDY6228839.1 Ger(x)C family spore germination protein [Clostridium sp.]